MDDRPTPERLTDALMQVPDEGLLALEAVAHSPAAAGLCRPLRSWLIASLVGERARRRFEAIDLPPLALDKYHGATLAGALAFAYCLTRSACDPLTEQFADLLHRLVISHVAAVLLGRHHPAPERED